MSDSPYNKALAVIDADIAILEERWFALDIAKSYKKSLTTLKAVMEIKSEDARMAKWKAQDFQDGYDLAISDFRNLIIKEVLGDYKGEN